jgi:hypothetical protein
LVSCYSPQNYRGPDDALLVLGAALGVILLTMVSMATAGKRIMRASSVLAVLICTAFVPAMTIALTFLLFWTVPDAPPPNDGPAMLFVSLFMLSFCAVPVSLVTSAFYVSRHGRKSVH